MVRLVKGSLEVSENITGKNKMYTDYKQMQSEIDSYMKDNSRLRAEWLWIENQGVGKLEKRMEGDVEVEKFVVWNASEFWKATQTMNGYYKWRYGQQERLKDLEKINNE